MRTLKAFVFGCLAMGCTLPTSADGSAGTQPDWLTSSWFTAFRQRMNLELDGTYEEYDDYAEQNAGWGADDEGTWSYDGSNVIVDSLMDDSTPLAVKPIVACRLVSFSGTIYESMNAGPSDCPNVEAPLSDAEAPFAGSYYTSSSSSSSAGGFPVESDNESITVALRSDRSFRIDWSTGSATPDYYTNGYATEFGRWSIDDQGNLSLTPLAASDGSNPPAATMTISVSGKNANIGGQTFTFTAE